MKYKVIYLLLFVIFLEGLFFAVKPYISNLKVDSGWDSGYSSGDSSSSDSYGGSSSSYSSGDYRGSRFTSTTAIIIEFFAMMSFYVLILYLIGKDKRMIALLITMIKTSIMVCLEIFVSIYFSFLSFIIAIPLAVIVWLKMPSDENSSKLLNYNDYRDLSDDELLEHAITDADMLKNELFDIFVKVEKAQMNFDYDELSKLCSNDLYDSSKKKLEKLELKNEKNVKKGFKLVDIKINAISENKSGITIGAILQVQFYDYVIDTKTNEVVRGEKDRLYDNRYKLVFDKEYVKSDKCPNCGKTIKTAIVKCNNCGEIIINNNTGYVLTSKGRF